MTMDEKPRPKPAPPKPKVEAVPVAPVKPTEKPKFVRKPHLTARPFKDNEELQKLQEAQKEKMRKSASYGKKPNPSRGQRRNNKESK